MSPALRLPALTWAWRSLFTVAFFALLWCAFVVSDQWRFQHAQGEVLDAALTARNDAAPLSIAAVAKGGVIGRVNIARLGISVVIVEGISSAILRHAAGHIVGTALPGQPGNSAISAHRDTFFRPLRNIRQDDIIAVATPQGDYRYRVVSIRIVPPEDVSVLEPSVNQVLTLVTCYPFYFVGAAADRFIVRAERIEDAS